MKELQKSYISLITLIQLENWSVRGLLDSKVTYNKEFELVRIGDFLRQSRTLVDIDDNTSYQRVRIKLRNGGVEQRDIQRGLNIGTKKQFRAKAGQFVVSKIDARNGAFGLIPDNLDGAIVTNDFPIFDVDSSKILPQFLVLITTTKAFIDFAQSCSSGTTNRQRMDIDSFLKQRIALPSLEEQECIVNAYSEKIERAKELEREAGNLDGEIEKYFLNKLGLKPIDLKERISGLQTTNFNDLDRWDVFSTDNRIAIELKRSKYELSSIGNSYLFAKRSFNKTKFEKQSFRYIEIGAIDPAKGILEAKKVSIRKAPSRATQIVKEGDLIIGTTRPYLKKFAIVSSEYDGDVCSSGFSVIAKSENYYLPYLDQFLKCTYGIEQLKNRMTGGLYPAITEGELKEIKIPFPKVSIQKQIMDLIEQKRGSILKNKENSVLLIEKANIEFEKAIFV